MLLWHNLVQKGGIPLGTLTIRGCSHIMSCHLRRLERRLFITDEEKVYGTIKEIAVHVTWISLFSFSGDTELEHF